MCAILKTMSDKARDNSTFRTGRLPLIDTLRGLTLLSMVAYHGLWDLVWLRGFPAAWYRGTPGFVWQQSICLSFILISGFCIPFSKRRLRRGLMVSAAGLLVTAVTLLVLPENRVVFGVLSFLGAAMLCMALAEKPFFSRIPAAIGLVASVALFAFFRLCNEGGFGLFFLRLGDFPAAWYRDLRTAALGFPPASFFSTDYFSFLPWIFWFLTGYFLSRLFAQCGLLQNALWQRESRVLSWLGRHALAIYLLHQVILYALLVLPFAG